MRSGKLGKPRHLLKCQSIGAPGASPFFLMQCNRSLHRRLTCACGGRNFGLKSKVADCPADLLLASLNSQLSNIKTYSCIS